MAQAYKVLSGAHIGRFWLKYISRAGSLLSCWIVRKKMQLSTVSPRFSNVISPNPSKRSAGTSVVGKI